MGKGESNMSEEKTLGALEKTIQEKAEVIFEERLDKAMDKIKNDEDLQVLRNLEVVVKGNTYSIVEFLIHECLKNNPRSLISIMSSSAYRKEEESLKQFKKEGINKIARELSDDFLKEYNQSH